MNASFVDSGIPRTFSLALDFSWKFVSDWKLIKKFPDNYTFTMSNSIFKSNILRNSCNECSEIFQRIVRNGNTWERKNLSSHAWQLARRSTQQRFSTRIKTFLIVSLVEQTEPRKLDARDCGMEFFRFKIMQWKFSPNCINIFITVCCQLRSFSYCFFVTELAKCTRFL